MADVLSVLAQPEVIVAIVTAVIGPVLLVLVDDRRAKKAAKERVVATTVKSAGGAEPVNVGIRALLDWSARQLGENKTLTERVAELQRQVNAMELRLLDAEKTIALQQQHIAILSSQVTDLGGVPFQMRPSSG